MPNFSAHFNDEEAPQVAAAIKASPEKSTSPYVRNAVLQRMEREGMMPGSQRAEAVQKFNELLKTDPQRAIKLVNESYSEAVA